MSRFGQFFRAGTTAALTALGVTPVFAQQPKSELPSLPPVPAVQAPAAAPVITLGPGCVTPVPACPPGAVMPNPGTFPGFTTPGMGDIPQGNLGTATAPAISGDIDSGFAAGSGPKIAGPGYIDTAVPVTMFRMRYDAAYGMNRPDRAEFFYAKCGCFRNPANFTNPQTGQIDPLYDPNAKGPGSLPEKNIDFQELTPYFEFALSERFSVFANIPVRYLNPEVNPNTSGFGDLSFGAKYAIVYTPKRVLSLQLRVITPTGRSTSGTGTGITWIEPGLLYQEQLTDRWQVFGQFKEQFYLQRQSDFTANVLTYGLGTSYVVAQGQWGYVAPVAEFVGWTVMGGKQLTEQGPQSAYGDTIVNGKFGVRVGFGAPSVGQPYPTRSDLYIGYGRALTTQVWYEDMFRLEYRLFF